MAGKVVSYTDEELKIREKTRTIREQIVDGMTEDGIPQNPKDIRLLSEVMNHLDDQIDKSANTRIRAKEQQADEDRAEVLAHLLKSTRFGTPDTETIDVEPELPDGYVDKTPVPGELEMKPTRLTMNDVVEKEEDDT